MDHTVPSAQKWITWYVIFLSTLHRLTNFIFLLGVRLNVILLSDIHTHRKKAGWRGMCVFVLINDFCFSWQDPLMPKIF